MTQHLDTVTIYGCSTDNRGCPPCPKCGAPSKLAERVPAFACTQCGCLFQRRESSPRAFAATAEAPAGGWDQPMTDWDLRGTALRGRLRALADQQQLLRTWLLHADLMKERALGRRSIELCECGHSSVCHTLHTGQPDVSCVGDERHPTCSCTRWRPAA